MTAIGLLILSAGIALVWAGITGQNALAEMQAAVRKKAA